MNLMMKSTYELIILVKHTLRITLLLLYHICHVIVQFLQLLYLCLYLLLSLQLLADIDDLREWFGEAERQIKHADPVCSNPDKLRALLRDHKVSGVTMQFIGA